MELELKHMAPYLPYGLTFIIENETEFTTNGFDVEFDNNNYIPNGLYQITGINYENSYLLDCVMFKALPHTENSIDGYAQIQSIKPALRPMSSLTKELYYELSGGNENDSFGFWYGKHNGDNDKREYIYHSGYTSRQYFLCDGYGQFSYRMMDFFFKNHFDIFGLIPAGLATELS